MELHFGPLASIIAGPRGRGRTAAECRATPQVPAPCALGATRKVLRKTVTALLGQAAGAASRPRGQAPNSGTRGPYARQPRTLLEGGTPGGDLLVHGRRLRREPMPGNHSELPVSSEPSSLARAELPARIRRWERRVLLAALAAYAFTLGAFDVYSPDGPLHLTVGQFLVQHRRVPTAADLLWTQPAKHWVDTEWLFQVVLYAVHCAGGVAAMVAMRCVLLCATAAALWAVCRRCHAGVAAAAIAFCMTAAGTTFGMRPGLFTLLLLSVYLLVLARARAREVWIALPLLGWVWANAHGYWAAGVVLVLLHALGRWVDARLGRPGGQEGAALPPEGPEDAACGPPSAAPRRAGPNALLGAAALCTVAAVLTPSLLDGFLYPFQSVGKLSGQRLWTDRAACDHLRAPIADHCGCTGIWELFLDEAGNPRPVFEKWDWSSLYGLRLPMDARLAARVAQLLAARAPADELAKSVWPMTEIQRQLTMRYVKPGRATPAQ